MDEFELGDLDFDSAAQATEQAQAQANAEAESLVADNDCGDACKI